MKKKTILIITLGLCFLMSSLYLHKVYAGKPTISLNSPVSFPVDI